MEARPARRARRDNLAARPARKATPVRLDLGRQGPQARSERPDTAERMVLKDRPVRLGRAKVRLARLGRLARPGS